MAKVEQVKLLDGTLIRHKVTGYEGRIDGTTEIKSCFTEAGEPVGPRGSKQIFQYRVFVEGEILRRIAPAEDLEIVQGIATIVCAGCHLTFHSKPGVSNKPGGRCLCGGWICPSCLACQDAGEQTPCPQQRKRFVKKMAVRKKSLAG